MCFLLSHHLRGWITSFTTVHPIVLHHFKSELWSAWQPVKKAIGDDELLVIMEADEVYTMTLRWFYPLHEWSNFEQFQQVMRSMNNWSIFSLFLSTTGMITQITFTRHKDRSGCVVDGILFLIALYTDLSFNQLARKIAHDGSFTLDDITSDNHMAH